jgi:hypothetical protein
LDKSLVRNLPADCPDRVQFKRYRDLMIGIILNLTCNVECEEMTAYMVKRDSLRLLKAILKDSRQDWPTNGAALALLQYCYISLSNQDMYLSLEENKIIELMSEYVDKCTNI